MSALHVVAELALRLFHHHDECAACQPCSALQHITGTQTREAHLEAEPLGNGAVLLLRLCELDLCAERLVGGLRGASVVPIQASTSMVGHRHGSNRMCGSAVRVCSAQTKQPGRGAAGAGIGIALLQRGPAGGGCSRARGTSEGRKRGGRRREDQGVSV